MDPRVIILRRVEGGRARWNPCPSLQAGEGRPASAGGEAYVAGRKPERRKRDTTWSRTVPRSPFAGASARRRSSPVGDPEDGRRNTPLRRHRDQRGASTSSWERSTDERRNSGGTHMSSPASHAGGHGQGNRERGIRRCAAHGARHAAHALPDEDGRVLPALGWCRKERGWGQRAFDAEVASLLGLTPAYVKGVVTFYTIYHQHPVGRYFVQVCTTSPCGVCGAEDVVKAFLRHTGTTSSVRRPPKVASP